MDAHYRLLTEHLNVKHLRAGHRQLDGRHGDLDLRHEVSRVHGRRGADGVPADRDVEPQLDAAAADHRFDPQRPRLEGRQLHEAAAKRALRVRLLRHRDQRRQPGAVQGGADAREGRPVARPAPCGAVPGRRERRALPVGLLARLQPLAGTGADQGHGARDQCGRRRAQPAGARPAGSRDQAREERPRAADPGEREHRGARHDGQWRSSTSASWASCCSRRRDSPRSEARRSPSLRRSVR